jgi:hypothetical protein
LAGRERVEGLGAETAERLAPDPARRHEPGGPQSPDMPRDERLRQADLGDELCDRGLGDREGPDDPEAVDVGQRLVDETQLAQLLRLEDGVGDRAADAGGRGAQGGDAPGSGSDEARAVGSTAVYINGG